jgi:hypothetical protein
VNTMRVGWLRRDQMVAVVGLSGIAGAVTATVWATDHLSYDIWAGVIIATALLGVSFPLVIRVEPDRRFARLLMWGLVARLVASVGRYLMTFRFADFGDAIGYALAGERLAELFRQGIFVAELRRSLVGTGFIDILSGIVFTITGPTLLGAFFIFSWLGFWGIYLFFRAFRMACCDGDAIRYALLVLFLPSLLFWSSTIGKEPWMLFTLGMSAYGVARVLSRRAGGYPALSLGLAGVTMVRPHMSVLLCCAMVFSYMTWRSPAEGTRLGLATRVGGIVVLAAVSAVVTTAAVHFFRLEDQEDQGVTEQLDAVLDSTQGRSTRGGSAYEAAPVRSPHQLPAAVVTVLFRPWPFEAQNTRTLVASVEGLALLGLTVVSLPRLAAVPLYPRRYPYVVFAVVYSLLFVVAFSYIGNFGILVRQRVQLLPLLFVLFALPPRRRRVTLAR